MTKTLTIISNALIAGQSTTRILGGAYSSLHFQTPSSSSSSSRFFPAEPFFPFSPLLCFAFFSLWFTTQAQGCRNKTNSEKYGAYIIIYSLFYSRLLCSLLVSTHECRRTYSGGISKFWSCSLSIFLPFSELPQSFDFYCSSRSGFLASISGFFISPLSANLSCVVCVGIDFPGVCVVGQV